MKHLIIFFFILTSYSILAQKNGAGSIEWIHDLGLERDKVVYVGQENEKFFWLKRRVKRMFERMHKNAGEKELYVYDIQKKELKSFKIKVDKAKWYMNYEFHAGRLYAFMTCYDYSSGKLEYWYKVYDTSTLKEEVSWTQIGILNIDKMRGWTRNEFFSNVTKPNPQTGSIYIELFTNKCPKGFGLILDKNGEIVKQMPIETGVPPMYLSAESPEIHHKYVTGQILTGEKDEKLIQLVYEKKFHDKKNSQAERDIEIGKLKVEFIDLENETTKAFEVGDDAHIYLSAHIMLSENDNEVLLTAISILGEDNDPFKMSEDSREISEYYTLFSVGETTGMNQLDQLETKSIDRYYYEFSRGPRMLTISSEIGAHKMLVGFLLRHAFIIDQVNSEEYFRSWTNVAVDTKLQKLLWDVPPIIFSIADHKTTKLFKIEHLSYLKDNGVNIVVGLDRYRIENDGTLEKLEPYEESKKNKFKEKMLPFLSQGLLERSDDFVIVGDGGGEFFIGILKK